MRLIDADKLIEKLRDFKEWETDDGRSIHIISEIQRIDRCINFAQAEPTPFDVNKVIEQLREISMLSRPMGMIPLKETVEIVKQAERSSNGEING